MKKTFDDIKIKYLKKAGVKLAVLFSALILTACTDDGNKPGEVPDISPTQAAEQTVLLTPEASPTPVPVETEVPVLPGVEEVLDMFESLSFRTFSKEEKENIIKDAEAKGACTVVFEADEAITLHQKNDAGEDYYITLHPDGTLDGIDGNNVPVLSAEFDKWSDCERLVNFPEPSFKIAEGVESADMVMVTFENVDFEAARAYGQELIASGLEYDESLFMDYEEFQLYAVEGTASDGSRVEYYFTPSQDDETAKKCMLAVYVNPDGIDIID